MSQFINIKKFTANALIASLVAGGLVTTFDVDNALSNNRNGRGNNNNSNNNSVVGCGNNGHGNNAPVTYNWNGGQLTISHYDPSNPSGQQTRSLIDGLVAGTIGRVRNGSNASVINYVDGTNNPSYSMTRQEATNLVNNHPDWELRGGSAIYDCGNDFDGDGISDAVELGSNVNNPLDTDLDGIFDFADTDSNNDGIPDGVSVPSSFVCPASNTITLTGTLRDFSDSHPDFERTPGVGGFRYGVDRGITTDTIGSDSKPVYAGGSFSTTTEDNFNEWYRDVNGVNKSTDYSITLTRNRNGKYRFQDTSFFPLDGMAGFDTEGYTHNGRSSGRPRNFHFTYELHSQFTYTGGEVLEFSGDDDVWVYINGKKVIDIGGVHSRTDASVDLDSVASSLGLVRGETYDFDFFFAERHTTQSNFILETNIELLCDSDNDGIANIVEGLGDADGDGIANYEDTDSDGNGILDGEEGTQDSDGDGTADYLDRDNDGNGHNDIEDSTEDSDGDGIMDYQDTDDDGDGTDDINDNDIDGDGIDNSSEDNPNLPPDFVFPNGGTPDDVDGDGIDNSVDPDSDGNGVNDTNENNGDYNEDGTPDPGVNTSDNDIDDDGVPNSLDTNDDGDDLTDISEEEYCLAYPNPNNPGGNCDHHAGIPDIYRD